MASVDIQGKRILFTGDIGRPHDAIMQAPAMVKYADFLICESTYGDRRHDTADPGRKLADVVNRTIARGGSVIVPSFAVGRAQALMHLVERLKADGAIPPTLPV